MPSPKWPAEPISGKVDTVESEDGEKPMSALEKHVAFFDKDGDGYVYPVDTFNGFRELGFKMSFSILSAILIHLLFSWITMRFPDPLLRIRVDNITKVKHGSDSEIYTSRGDFDENRFEYSFNANTQPPHTQISWKEVEGFLNTNKNAYDPVGRAQAQAEWKALFKAIGKDGFMRKEDLRAFYDGTLFYRLAEEHRNKMKAT
ncbi:hypothetical protein ONZ45_g4077 [Pleurotus djamor]|nr:hypothetical protein ONZ45_g4077 [Pleurotus djamor]